MTLIFINLSSRGPSAGIGNHRNPSKSGLGRFFNSGALQASTVGA
jgi:hypothetical protein